MEVTVKDISTCSSVASILGMSIMSICRRLSSLSSLLLVISIGKMVAVSMPRFSRSVICLATDASVSEVSSVSKRTGGGSLIDSEIGGTFGGD